MPISAALKRIYASAPTDQRYIETLSFAHSQFTKTHYLCNDLDEWTFLLESGAPQAFQRLPFQILLPNNDRNGSQDLQIAISNVTRDLMYELELANEVPTEPIVVTYRVYLNQLNTEPQNTPVLEMTVTEVNAKADVISAVAKRANILNKPFPSVVYRIDTFPGLDR